jgi:hypothetical protein
MKRVNEERMNKKDFFKSLIIKSHRELEAVIPKFGLQKFYPIIT